MLFTSGHVGTDVTDGRREEAQAWSLFHPREAKVAARLVAKHIKHLYDEKSNEIKAFQHQRQMFQEQLTKAQQVLQDPEMSDEEVQEASQMVVDLEKALAAVEGDLIEAHRARIKYCKDRIVEHKSKLKSAEVDRTHLFVSHHVRPSEKEVTLLQQKEDHVELMERYKEEIAKMEKVVETTEKELELLGFNAEAVKNGDEDGGEIGSNEDTEWATIYDEASGMWYYYNNYTGESRWA